MLAESCRSPVVYMLAESCRNPTFTAETGLLNSEPCFFEQPIAILLIFIHCLALKGPQS